MSQSTWKPSREWLVSQANQSMDKNILQQLTAAESMAYQHGYLAGYEQAQNDYNVFGERPE